MLSNDHSPRIRRRKSKYTNYNTVIIHRGRGHKNCKPCLDNLTVNIADGVDVDVRMKVTAVNVLSMSAVQDLETASASQITGQVRL